MATVATANTGFSLSIIAKPFVALGKFLVETSEANHRLKSLRKLTAMSDKELAQRGLKREDLVHHVFGDRMYV